MPRANSSVCSTFPFFPFPKIFVLILQIRVDIRMSVTTKSMNKSKEQIVYAIYASFYLWRELWKQIQEKRIIQFLGSGGSFIRFFLPSSFISYMSAPWALMGYGTATLTVLSNSEFSVKYSSIDLVKKWDHINIKH